MKKTTIIITSIITVLILGTILFNWRQNAVENNLKNICLSAANTGWAPVGPIEFAPKGCDGERLDANSPLIDGDGYTCYCHIPNTCWNGSECVSK